MNNEYDLKAYFIFTFTHYIEWADSSQDKFIIGILGDHPIAIPLIKIAKLKTVNNKEITIRLWQSPDEIGYCHILFVDESMKKELKSILKKINGKNILTISDTKDFGKEGVAINFFLKNEKIKFEINKETIANASLKISSQLLKLANFVDANN